MVLKKKHVTVWEPVKMPVKPDYVWPWSTWVALKKEAELNEPHNMALLIQHAYARCPLTSCWKVKRRDANPREALGPRDYLQRRYVPNNYVVQNRKLHPDFVAKPRFILPRFRNVPAKIDDKWAKWPLSDRNPPSFQRRSAISVDGSEAERLRKEIAQNAMKSELDEESKNQKQP